MFSWSLMIEQNIHTEQKSPAKKKKKIPDEIPEISDWVSRDSEAVPLIHKALQIENTDLRSALVTIITVKIDEF